MNVTAKRSDYDENKHLALLKKIDPCYGVALLIEKVTSKEFMIFEVYVNDQILGIFLAKVDSLIDNTREFVILNAAAVVDPEVPLTSVLNPVFSAVARQIGLRSIRVHSDKKGLDKLLEENNFIFMESIYRKVL